MTAMPEHRVVIVGAGQAGSEAAFRLRQAGYVGSITLIGDEPLAPYQRPPLSKAFLKGELGLDRLMLRAAESYDRDRVELLTGAEASAIDRDERSLRTRDGRHFRYDALVLATGARPRTLELPGSELAGVHVFRTASHVDAIRTRLRTGANLVVLGAGYIGLEVAAVARQLGLDVTVVEAAERPLARVTSAAVADFYLAEHLRQGVKFFLSTRAVAIEGDDQVRRVALSDGSEIPADVVVIGVGVTPDIELAMDCGLKIENGIVTDGQCRTSDATIYAIGDCAMRPMTHFGGRMSRLESVHNALEGAKIVAAAITNSTPPQQETPWFWSDQYDLKLQIAGLLHDHDSVVLRGSTADRAFAAFYYKGDRLLAVDAVNRPAEFLGAKLLIQNQRSISPSAAMDTSRSFKDLMATAR